MAHWEVWLCDPSGVRLTCLRRTAGFAVSRVQNAIGATTIVLPEYYDDLVKLDYILEYWRKPNGGTLKFYRSYFMRHWRYDEDTHTTQVWGYDGNYITDGRTVAYDAASAQSLQTDYLDDMCKVIAIDAFGADAGAGRDLSSVGGGVSVAAELGAAPSATKGFSWRGVLDVFADLAAASRAAGTNLYYDMVESFTSAGKIAWTFRTYTGTRGADHTSDSDNPLHFGAAWGNLSGGYYEVDHTEERKYGFGRGQGERMRLVAEGITRRGDGQFGDGTNIARVDHLHRNLLFAALDVQTRHTFFHALALVPHTRIPLDRTAIYTEIGHFAHERIGGRFPDIGSQRTRIGASQFFLVTVLAEHNLGRTLGGRGHQIHHGVQQGADTNFMPACGHENRHERSRVDNVL